MAPPNAAALSLWLVAAGLLISSSLSGVLLWASITSETNSGQIYNYVTTHRASTQIVVQILSHVLGAALVLPLTTLINLVTRTTLARKPTSLHQISFYSQLYYQRISFNLPSRFWFMLITFYAITLVPAALWAGAITPVKTTIQKASLTQIPIYSLDPRGLHWNTTNSTNIQYAATAANTTNPLGIFSFYPSVTFGGQILNTASLATSTNSTIVPTHPKYDNTRYSFSGRSYGVGSSVGLVGDVLEMSNLAQYSYLEAGYKTNVFCTVNASSLFNIWRIDETVYKGVPVNYLAAGPLPNSVPVADNITRGPLKLKFSAQSAANIPMVTFNSYVALTAVASQSGSSRNIISIATQGTGSLGNETVTNTYYDFLNNTQCEVEFVPKTFRVNVNVSELLITVVDTNTSHTPDIDPTTVSHGPGLGVVAQRAMSDIRVFGHIYTTLYTSVVGDMLVSNVRNAYQSSELEATEFSDVTVNHRGVAEAFQSILDDVLLGHAAAQLMLTPDGRNSTTVIATVNALRIGQNIWIYSIVGVNFVIVALFTVTALWHTGWRNLHVFDYTDLISLVIATSLGGRAIADQSSGNYYQHGRGSSSGIQISGNLKVQMKMDKDERAALVAADTANVDSMPLVSYNSEGSQHGYPLTVTTGNDSRRSKSTERRLGFERSDL